MVYKDEQYRDDFSLYSVPHATTEQFYDTYPHISRSSRDRLSLPKILNPFLFETWPFESYAHYHEYVESCHSPVLYVENHRLLIKDKLKIYAHEFQAIQLTQPPICKISLWFGDRDEEYRIEKETGVTLEDVVKMVGAEVQARASECWVDFDDEVPVFDFEKR